MINNKHLKNAFTMLEMLVVIGIIAILIGMGSVSYSTAQKKARDSKRKLDIGAIKNAMEQYYALCKGTYPAAVSGKTPDPIEALTADGCSSDTMIMSQTPKDPKVDEYYDYDDGGGVSTPSICASDGATTPNLMETESAPYCIYLEQ